MWKCLSRNYSFWMGKCSSQEGINQVFSAMAQLLVLNSKAVLFIVGCSASAHGLCLLHARKILAPRCDSQKCFQTVPDAYLAANLALAWVLLWLGKKIKKINTAKLYFSLLHVQCKNSWLTVSLRHQWCLYMFLQNQGKKIGQLLAGS